MSGFPPAHAHSHAGPQQGQYSHYMQQQQQQFYPAHAPSSSSGQHHHQSASMQPQHSQRAPGSVSPSGAGDESKESIDGHDDRKAKRTRNRRPASCESCRKKKMRCDRLLPCDTCKSRGEENLCSYGEGSAPLHVPGNTAEMNDLKLQVDRLSALVDTLSRNASNAAALDALKETLGRKTGGAGDESSLASSPSHAPGDGDESTGDLNLKSLDICEALGQLTVNGVIHLDAQSTQRAPILVEARANLGQGSAPTKQGRLGTFPFSSNPDSIEKIMAILPTLQQAETVIQCFSHQLSWYIQPFPWKTFDVQWAKLKESTTADADCSFLGVFLAVCGLGLYFLPDKHAQDFPPGEGKKQLVNQWLDASASALTLAHFLDNPSLNSIHAMQLLTAWHIYLSPGDTSSTGFAILSMAAEATLQLGLHREPDPNLYTPFEANMRRATFWWTVMLEALAGSSLGKTWSLFQLKHCDAKLPLEVDEAAFTPDGYLRPDYEPKGEINMSSILLRMKIAQASKQISEKAFSIQNVSFSTVLELDRELHKLEDSFPPHYRLDFQNNQLVYPPGIKKLTRLRSVMVNVALLQEYIRLHRPFVASGAAFNISRNSCIRASRMAIAMFKELAQFNYGGLTFKTISSCCVLCMDLISNPTSPEAAAMRDDVAETIQLLEKNKGESRLASNGSKLLQFLLNKSLSTYGWFPGNDGSAVASGNGGASISKRGRTYSDESCDSALPVSANSSEQMGSRPYVPRRTNVPASLMSQTLAAGGGGVHGFDYLTSAASGSAHQQPVTANSLRVNQQHNLSHSHAAPSSHGVPPTPLSVLTVSVPDPSLAAFPYSQPSASLSPPLSFLEASSLASMESGRQPQPAPQPWARVSAGHPDMQAMNGLNSTTLAAATKVDHLDLLSKPSLARSDGSSASSAPSVHSTATPPTQVLGYDPIQDSGSYFAGVDPLSASAAGLGWPRAAPEGGYCDYDEALQAFIGADAAPPGWLH